MKYYTYLYLGLLLVISGCDDFLGETPKSILVEDQFYQTEADFRVALTSTYQPLQTLYNNSVGLLTSVDTDEAGVGNFPGGEVFDFQNNAYGPGSSSVQAWWNNNYEGINQANAIISNATEVSLPSEERELVDSYVAEAKFLRGLYYFNLVLAFGDVPLKLEATESLDNLTLNRSPMADVYTQIEQDLMDAEQALPESYGGGEVGRATSGAAKAVLAKVYLFQDNFQDARNKSLEVIESGQYELLEDYLDILSVSAKNGVEHIFSVQYARGLTESGMGRLYGFSATTVEPSEEAVPEEVKGQSTWSVEDEFYESFPEGYRKEVSLVPRELFDVEDSVIKDANIYHNRKYFDNTKAEAESGSNANNFNVIRYADILLVFAEADNEVNGGPTVAAYEAINQVRRRSQQLDINTPDANIDLTGLGAEEFREAVWDERTWELAFEGHRRWDLLRTGRYLEAVDGASARNTLFPIPQTEIDLNPSMRQNEGY